MNGMRYNLPTLLALCHDTGVQCKWTSEARHCEFPIVTMLLINDLSQESNTRLGCWCELGSSTSSRAVMVLRAIDSV